jgi:pilus assembly protein CpaB
MKSSIPLNWQTRLQHLKTKPWWRLETGLILGAVICGLLSGIIKRAHDREREAELERVFATEAVLITAADMVAGESLSKAKVRIGQILSNNVTRNHVRPADMSLILGKQIAVHLKQGDPLLLTLVQGGAEASGIADKIPAGKRLFTLNISDNAANNGFIRPNDHVDIMAHVKLPDRGLTTFTVLHDVTLISVGRSTLLDGGKAESASNISFFVDARQAEMLAFAQKNGTFALSLRNPKDVGKQVKGKGIDINEFLDFEGIHQASGGGELSVTENGRSVVKGKGKHAKAE